MCWIEKTGVKSITKLFWIRNGGFIFGGIQDSVRLGHNLGTDQVSKVRCYSRKFTDPDSALTLKWIQIHKNYTNPEVMNP